MANSISVKVSDIDDIIGKVNDFENKVNDFRTIFETNKKEMLGCFPSGPPAGFDISSEPIDKMCSSLERFKHNLDLAKNFILDYSDGLTDEYLKEMLPLIYVSEDRQDEYKITKDSRLKFAEPDAPYLKDSDLLLKQKESEITAAIAAKKTTSAPKGPEDKDTGTAAARNTAAITSTGSFTSAVQPRYSSTESSSQTNLTQNNDTSANTSKNTFSSSDSKSNISTSSPTTSSPETTSPTTSSPKTTSPTTTSPETTSPTTSTPSTSQTPSSTILTPKNNSNSSSSEQVHTGGGYSSSSGYTGTGDYNSDTSNATPSTPSTPETMAPGNTSKLSDEELTSIKNVIDNSKIHTTTIPKSNTPISSDTKSGGGGSSVIPISAGLTAAAAAGLGAKAYLDRKNNNDNGSSDEINTDEWTGDESVDIKYDDSSDNQEGNTLDADDDYSYQPAEETEKYDAKANNELMDLQ